MTIGELISTLRTLIKETQDDSAYTNSFLWSLLSSCRDPKKIESRHIQTSFCIKLVEIEDPNCYCKSCKVKRTEFAIPKPINLGHKDIIAVYSPKGQLIGQAEENELRYLKYDPILANKPRWYFDNQFIKLTNVLDLEYIVVKGVWENVVEWANIRYCPNEDCVDVYDLESTITQMEADNIYIKALNLLRIALTRPNDTSADKSEKTR